MANVLDALKNMFVKLGGDKTKLNNNHDISDYINDIADVLKDDIEIASELPIVSTDDNGKVLGVVEGNWSKTDIPSEVPAAAAADIGKVLGVVSDGESGAEYRAISMPSPSSDIVIIEFPDDYPEDIESLPEGVTGEYIYNLVHSGKTVYLACGADSEDGRFLLPVYRVYLNNGSYIAYASLALPKFSSGAGLVEVEYYYIQITDTSIYVDYQYTT